MTLYYSLVFVILVTEMALFFLIVAPMPKRLLKGVLGFLSSNPFVAQISIAVKFTFAFILILFVDSVNRVWRVQSELAYAKSRTSSNVYQDRDEWMSRKFYAQRNMYLCGFTLFLSLTLRRTYLLVKQLVDLQDKVGGNSTSNTSELEKKLEHKEKDYDALKKQSDSLSREYDRVCDELNSKKPMSDKKNQ